MTDDTAKPDARASIDNALAILSAAGADEPHAVKRNLALAANALRAARDEIDALNAELDLVTAPDVDAAREVQRLERELATAQGRIAELEQASAMLRRDLDIETNVHADENRRLKELEKRAKDFESVLMEDDEAFGRFMDRALDEDERKRKRP
jgi:DNA repair exonuclease SbcCD ATPase subunit